MKKFFALVVMCFVMFSGNIFGQDAAKNKNDKKGGFSVGGYDQSRKAKAPTRSIEINKEVEKSEKSMEMNKPADDIQKAEAPVPANMPEAKEAPAAVRPKEAEKGKQGNAYGKTKSKRGNAYGLDKNKEGKETGSSRSNDAKLKEKPKADLKPDKEQK